MRRILHLSDLHFGRTSGGLLAPLLRLVDEVRPDLTVVSGDLTQRARASQFRAARAFLDRLPGPVLSVPGNHDVPLWNLPVRLVAPFARYRRFIARDLEPVHEDDHVIVAGVNTVNPMVWQQGRLTGRMIDRLAHVFSRAAGRTCIAVMHHPIEQLPEWQKTPMRGAAEALEPLRAAGVQVVLSGHIHLTHVAPATAAPGLLLVQAGTGLSDRLRSAPNAVNLLTVGPGEVTVATHEAVPDGTFARQRVRAFRVASDAWAAGEEAAPPVVSAVPSPRAS